MKKYFIPIFFVVAVAVAILIIINRPFDKGDVAGSSDQIKVHGLVVPHHSQAGAVITSAINQLSAFDTYQTIVVISPNHFKPNSPLVVGGEILDTFLVDQELMVKLDESSTNIILDSGLIAKEHGLLVPMSYLAESFSESKFIPVMISPNYTNRALDDLARVFDAVLPANTLFVVSVDFSHDMLYEEAMTNTRHATSIIKHFDHDTLLTFDDKYMDTPVAVSLLMRIMQLRRATDFQEWEINHGAVLFDNPILQGTSYLTGVFQEQ